jgi:ABC-type antimicrobial peptide transport system permease subunit
MIYGIRSWDPAAFAGSAALLSVVAIAAGYFPAVRATRVDPIDILRND